MNAENFVHYLSGAIKLGGLNSVDYEKFHENKSTLENMKFDSSKESQFCLWLQGVLDISNNSKLSVEQFSKVISKINSLADPSFSNSAQKTRNSNLPDGVTIKC